MSPARLVLAGLTLLVMGFAPARIEGSYRLTGMHEAASVLDLQENGRFRFALSYGALDEIGEGRWRQEGGRILLTTEPVYRNPHFELSSAAQLAEPLLRVRIFSAGGKIVSWPIEIFVMLKDGGTVDGRTQGGEYALERAGGGEVAALRFGINVYGFLSEPIPIDASRGYDLAFELQPNSLGQPPFNDQPLLIEGENLIMLRGDARMTYRRED